MADEPQAVPDFLDQNEIDKLLTQATESAAPKQLFIRADGKAVDGKSAPKAK